MSKEKNLQDALAKVRALLFAEAPTEEAPTNEDAKTLKGKDGKEYKAAKLEAGEVIEVVNADGTTAPAADGDVELEDGTVITVKGGKIESVKAAEALAADAPKPEDKPADAPKGEVTKADLDKVNETVAGLAEMVKTLVEKNGLQMQAMFELVEATTEESTETPVGEKKHNAFATVKTAKEEAKAKVKEAFAAVGTPKK